MSNRYISQLVWSRVHDFHLTRKKIERARKKRLEHLWKVATEYVPGQQERLRGAQAGNLKDLDPINKRQMMSDPGAYVNQRILHDLQISREDLSAHLLGQKTVATIEEKIRITKTSGTTGEPGLVLNTQATWNRQQAWMIGRIGRRSFPLTRVLGLKQYRIAYLILDRPWMINNQIANTSQRSARSMMDARTFSIEQPPSDLHRALSDFQPHFIMSYPNILVGLARARMQGKFQWDPEVLLSSSDLLDPSQYKEISDAFPKTTICNMYASSEFLPIATSCRLGHLHQSEDCCIIEPVDTEGNPVSNGEFSDHILVTGLLNDFHPFIRYRMEDEVRFIEAPCPCGSPLPVLEIRGRRNPEIPVKLGNGHVKHLNSRQVRMAILKTQTFDRFQVICKPDIWLVSIYPEVQNDHELRQFDLQHRSVISHCLEAFSEQHGLNQSLQIKIDFKRLDLHDTRNLKRKLFIIEK
ncbi:MAG: hypothetical protein KTR24_18340 [Saprospiraceae bacterium]|nr:hypothetical protein [Saprospiraceae bacterium]